MKKPARVDRRGRPPLYRLPKQEEATWYRYMVRDCVNHPRGEKDPKYPPLSPAERREFNKLDQKRRRLIDSSPAVQASIQAQRRHNQKIRRLLAQIGKLIERAPVEAERSSRI